MAIAWKSSYAKNAARNFYIHIDQSFYASFAKINAVNTS